jgi:hypothetical protein
VTGSIAVKDMEEKPSKAAFVQSAATGRPHQLAPTSLPASSSLWSGKEKFVLLKVGTYQHLQSYFHTSR